MDEVLVSANAFEKMFKKKYKIVIAYKKQLLSFEMDFRKEDFAHLVGLQYLKDLDLGKNDTIIYEKIVNKEITDDLLARSCFYLQVDNNYVKVKERIADFKHIEECIDSKSIVVKYIKGKNAYSMIDADFLITVALHGDTYYIFIRKRRKEETYMLCSFFKKVQECKGDKAYWLYKEKIDEDTATSIVLYDRLSKV